MRVSSEDMDFYMLDEQFKFACHPYFLRLTFAPGCKLVEDGREKATFDPMAGTLVWRPGASNRSTGLASGV